MSSEIQLSCNNRVHNLQNLDLHLIHKSQTISYITYSSLSSVAVESFVAGVMAIISDPFFLLQQLSSAKNRFSITSNGYTIQRFFFFLSRFALNGSNSRKIQNGYLTVNNVILSCSYNWNKRIFLYRNTLFEQ